MFVQLALAAALAGPAAAPAEAAPRTVLVVSEARGFVHDSIPAARAALHRLDGRRDRRRATWPRGTSPPRACAAPTRSSSRVTTGDLPVDRPALRRFVRRGGGLAGFHSATATFASWPAWERLIGGRFDHHEEPGADRDRARRRDPGHPAVARRPGDVPDARGVVPARAGRRAPGAGARAMGRRRAGRSCGSAAPGRGRVFYDALGHFPATWQDPRQEALVRSGLRWVLRL